MTLFIDLICYYHRKPLYLWLYFFSSRRTGSPLLHGISMLNRSTPAPTDIWQMVRHKTSFIYSINAIKINIWYITLFGQYTKNILGKQSQYTRDIPRAARIDHCNYYSIKDWVYYDLNALNEEFIMVLINKNNIVSINSCIISDQTVVCKVEQIAVIFNICSC